MEKFYKSKVVRFLGIPSTRIDWMWRKRLLTYDDRPGRQYRREYTLGMIFEILAVDKMMRAWVPREHIREFLRFVKALVRVNRGAKSLGYDFDPYHGQLGEGEKVSVRIVDNEWFYLDVRKGSDRFPVGKALRLRLGSRRKKPLVDVYTVDEAPGGGKSVGADHVSRDWLEPANLDEAAVGEWMKKGHFMRLVVPLNDHELLGGER